MAEATYVETFPPMTTDDISRLLNHNRYYGCNTWVWNNTLNVFGVPGMDNWLMLPPKEAADIAFKLQNGWTLPRPSFLPAREIPTMQMSPLFDPPEYYKNMDYVADVLNQNKHRNQTDWKWDSGDQAFVIRGARYVHSINGVDAQYIAGFYQTREKNMGNALKMEPAPAPLHRTPRLNRTIELVIEADNHLVVLSDAASGIADKPIRAQIGVIGRMMTLLKHDLRSVERQTRESK